MRRNVVWGMSTLSAVVLLFSYHTSTAGADGTLAAPKTSGSLPTASATTTEPTDTTTSGDSVPSPSSSSSSSPTSTSSSSTTQASGSQTFTGETVQTRWGPVQVEITVTEGKITASKAVQYPWSNGRDQEINSYALPILNKATVEKQSADLDGISGATVTWSGYTQSLQSALDQANL